MRDFSFQKVCFLGVRQNVAVESSTLKFYSRLKLYAEMGFGFLL